jgi:hypothetical protein
MQAHWKQTSAKCHEYIEVNEPHRLYGKVVEENGVFAVWYLSKDGGLKKSGEVLPSLTSARIVVEATVENPNVGKL